LKTKRTIQLAFVITALVGLTAACTSNTTDTGNTTQSRTYQLSAAMDTHQVVSPTNKPWKAPASVAKAKATFSGSLDSSTGELTWQITYTGLPASQVPLADDVHLGEQGHFGQFLVRLCTPCDPGGQSGHATVKKANIADIVSGGTWVTVITQKYPNGIIRGQVRAE
jgi:hypothetical protein